LKAIFYEKGIKFEKKEVQLWASIYSVVHECTIKVSDSNLNFGYVLALLTTYFWYLSLLKNLPEGGKTFLHRKSNMLRFPIQCTILTDVQQVVARRISI